MNPVKFFHGGRHGGGDRVRSATQPCRVLLVVAISCLAQAVHAQEDAPEESAAYAEAVASIEADLEAELANLAALRDRIAAEKPPLAKKTNAIAAEYREKARRAELARQERDALIHDLGEISDRVRLWRDESAYIDSLLGEFRKEHEGRISLAKAEAMRHSFALSEREDEQGLTARLNILEAALGHLANAGSLEAVEGEALGPDGVSRQGRFVEAGPVGWFVATEGDLAGLAIEGATWQPEIVPDTATAEQVNQLAAGNAVSLWFDPTLGTALALGEADDSLIDHIRQGGLWIYPILLLALIATLAAVGKWIQLLRIRDIKPGFVREILAAVNGGRIEAATKSLEGVRHPVRALLERGIETRHRSREEVEEALYEKYLEAQPPLQRGLSLIAIASATAPLLGLLGTVTGMIHTFKLINIFGTGDAKSLASGISEALVTTEFGLVVAIPALILHALLSRKVQGIRSTMEMTSLAFVNGLEEPGETPRKPASPTVAD